MNMASSSEHRIFFPWPLLSVPVVPVEEHAIAGLSTWERHSQPGMCVAVAAAVDKMTTRQGAT